MKVKKQFYVDEYTVTIFERESDTKHGPRVKVTEKPDGKTIATFSVSKDGVKQVTGTKHKAKLKAVAEQIKENADTILNYWYGAPQTVWKEEKQKNLPTTYVGISRDHSASMQHLTGAAKKDYNDQLDAISKAAVGDVLVTTIKCAAGSHASNIVEHVGVPISLMPPLKEYVADGRSTPLFDSVAQLIDIMSGKKPKDSVFLIMAITDGEDNSSKISANALGDKIRELQKTDRWTFTFRVPKGYAHRLSHYLGIPMGNILEWEQTSRGVEEASIKTAAAMSSYFGSVASGQMTASRSFYTQAADLKTADLKANMADITRQVEIHTVPLSGTYDVSSFSTKFLGRVLEKGTLFYQLMKRESKVQDYKIICIRDRKTTKVFGGSAARDMLGIPRTGTHSIIPGNHGQYDIFIQSTSLNRKLPQGTKVLYWEGVPK